MPWCLTFILPDLSDMIIFFNIWRRLRIIREHYIFALFVLDYPSQSNVVYLQSLAPENQPVAPSSNSFCSVKRLQTLILILLAGPKDQNWHFSWVPQASPEKSQSRYQNICKNENRILNFLPHACQSGTPRTSSTDVPILNFLSVSGQAISWLLTKQATAMSRKAGKRNFMFVHFVFDLPRGWRLTMVLRFCNLWIMIRAWPLSAVFVFNLFPVNLATGRDFVSLSLLFGQYFYMSAQIIKHFELSEKMG